MPKAIIPNSMEERSYVLNEVIAKKGNTYINLLFLFNNPSVWKKLAYFNQIEKNDKSDLN